MSSESISTPGRGSYRQRLAEMPTAQQIYSTQRTDDIGGRTEIVHLDEMRATAADMSELRRITQSSPVVNIEEAPAANDDDWEAELRRQEEEGERQALAAFQAQNPNAAGANPRVYTARVELDAGPDERYELTAREPVGGTVIRDMFGVLAGQPSGGNSEIRALAQQVEVTNALVARALLGGAMGGNGQLDEVADSSPQQFQSASPRADQPGDLAEKKPFVERKSGRTLVAMLRHRKLLTFLMSGVFVGSLTNVSVEAAKQGINGTVISRGDVFRKAFFLGVDTRESIARDRGVDGGED